MWSRRFRGRALFTFSNSLTQARWSWNWCRREFCANGCARLGPGIPAFYSPVGVGTDVAKGKEERVIRGKRYILEQALGADLRFY